MAGRLVALAGCCREVLDNIYPSEADIFETA